ncbi:gamma-glutamyl phosphate reductase-like protein [Leptomonas seymouri]|uniref:Gamma-glutamyl phosphate reductase-like protein n=1 Tax=Leptomonas seymouri TaxID=5684 RepID=A0A0N1PBT0_LEPSE|nr:gamma-glutamyl phosphate reductase-like protein [Leptomonas seymouri]|eukprot:KPI84125.1 gamma-glutamyl phosphate reductase-like protein [Leptomonas seymouri]
MRRSVCRHAVQNVLHDVQAAAESRTVVATSSFAQRRTFLMALHEELQRNREVIIRANRRDCEAFGQQQQQRGTPSVTIPPTMPSVAASLPSAGRMMHTPYGGGGSSFGGVMLGSHHAGQDASSAAVTAATTTGGHSSVGYVASTALSCTANAADAAALMHSTAGAEPLGVLRSTGGTCGDSTHKGCRQTSVSAAAGAGSSSSVAEESAHSFHTVDAATSETGVAPFRGPPPVHEGVGGAGLHAEAGGGGGHLLLTPDHHLLISPLRLDKLHNTIDYLLCQPDPIAVPPSCWLRPYAERGSGDVLERQRSGFAQIPPAIHQGGDDGGAPTQGVVDGLTPRERYTYCGRRTRLTDQLEVFELPVPLGMIGVLSRFRPRIGLDAVAMGLFAGNTVLVDGGVSLSYTNIALMTAVRRALTAAGLPPTAVVCVESYDAAHRSTSEWLQLSEYVDLAVVCGPPKLYQFATRHSTVPLIRATGQFSSVYIDQSASFEVALEVVLNSKFQKLGAANAVTTAIVHRDFPRYTELLMAFSAGGAVLLGDVVAQGRVPDSVLELASEEEYRGLTQFGLRDGTRALCIKTVDSLAQALFFIESYGSKQSDCVVATDPDVCATFCRQVDTAVALVNASTRLSSGEPLGCGVDFAISTSKAHCRGPLTLSMMTTRKLVVRSRSINHGALR